MWERFDLLLTIYISSKCYQAGAQRARVVDSNDEEAVNRLTLCIPGVGEEFGQLG